MKTKYKMGKSIPHIPIECYTTDFLKSEILRVYDSQGELNRKLKIHIEKLGRNQLLKTC